MGRGEWKRREGADDRGCAERRRTAMIDTRDKDRSCELAARFCQNKTVRTSGAGAVRLSYSFLFFFIYLFIFSFP